MTLLFIEFKPFPFAFLSYYVALNVNEKELHAVCSSSVGVIQFKNLGMDRLCGWRREMCTKFLERR